MFDRGVPSICYSLRGLAYFQIDLRGTKSDLHSGGFGGAVANPAMVLAQILAQMKDRSGHIRIPGFYDDVRALSEEERAAWKTLPFNEKKYRKDLGAPKLAGEREYSVLERVWARPTFEVNGLLSGFTGEGAKTVIPAVAMAKVSMRLVPDQDPDKIAQLFEAHLKKVAPGTVELKVTRMHGGKPWITDYDNPSSAARADRFLSSRRFRRSSGFPRCCLGLACRTRTRTRQTNGSTSRTSTTVSWPQRSCTTRSRRSENDANGERHGSRSSSIVAIWQFRQLELSSGAVLRARRALRAFMPAVAVLSSF
jgi:hypothetical protein